MRSRNRLAVSRIHEFAAFCESKGWEKEECKGYYEVLRMRHAADKQTLIVHEKLSTAAGKQVVHLTTHGNSERMLNQYFRERAK